MSDEYETPQELYQLLCDKYRIFPTIDVAATHEMKKCDQYFTKQDSGLENSWDSDVWCNPPHTLTGKFVEKAYNEWRHHNINIILLIPANTVSSKFWHSFIEGNAEYYAQPQGRIRFLQDGKPSKYQARNAYMVVIFRRRR